MARSVEIRLPDHLVRGDDQRVWEDLETYLYQGFLTVSATAHQQAFVFKSLNHHELRMIEYYRRSTGSQDISTIQARACFIAYSVLYMNGNNFLAIRDRSLNKLIRILSKFPVQVLDQVIENLSSLNKRALRLHPLVEVYSFENRSRFRWFQTKVSSVHHSINTGIPGTEFLGMNYCQQTWTALNCVIDRKEDTEREWANAKFIGGCFAGKAIRGIEDRDRARQEREKSERDDKKVEILRDYVNHTTGKGPEPVLRRMPNGQMVEIVGRYSAESREELADQLSAALSGEKDLHDLIVEQHTNKLREAAGEMEVGRVKLLQSSGEMSDIGTPVAGGGSRVLRDKEEADRMLARIQLIRESNRQSALSKFRGEDPSGSDEDPQ